MIPVFDWKNNWIFNVFLLETNQQLLTSNEYYNTHL